MSKVTPEALKFINEQHEAGSSTRQIAAALNESFDIVISHVAVGKRIKSAADRKPLSEQITHDTIHFHVCENAIVNMGNEIADLKNEMPQYMIFDEELNVMVDPKRTEEARALLEQIRAAIDAERVEIMYLKQMREIVRAHGFKDNVREMFPAQDLKSAKDKRQEYRDALDFAALTDDEIVEMKQGVADCDGEIRGIVSMMAEIGALQQPQVTGLSA